MRINNDRELNDPEMIKPEITITSGQEDRRNRRKHNGKKSDFQKRLEQMINKKQ